MVPLQAEKFTLQPEKWPLQTEKLPLQAEKLPLQAEKLPLQVENLAGFGVEWGPLRLKSGHFGPEGVLSNPKVPENVYKAKHKDARAFEKTLIFTAETPAVFSRSPPTRHDTMTSRVLSFFGSLHLTAALHPYWALRNATSSFVRVPRGQGRFSWQIGPYCSSEPKKGWLGCSFSGPCSGGGSDMTAAPANWVKTVRDRWGEPPP
jgi:hypothetical protein